MSSSSNYLMTVQSPLSGAEYDSEQPTANGQSLWQQSQPYNIPAPIYNHTRALVHHSSYNTLVPMSSSATASPYQQSQSQSPTLHGGGITNIKPHLITRYNTTSPIGDTNNNKFTDNRMVIPIIVSTPNSCGTESPMEPYSINSSNSHTQGQGICNSSPVSISCHNGPTARNNNPPTFASSPIQSYRPPATLNSNMSLSQSRISSPSAPITPCSPPHPFNNNNNNNNNSNSGRQTSQNMSQTVHQSISPIVHVNSRQGLGPCASDLRLLQGQGPPQAVTTGTGTGYRPTVQTNYTYSGGSNRIIQPGKEVYDRLIQSNSVHLINLLYCCVAHVAPYLRSFLSYIQFLIQDLD